MKKNIIFSILSVCVFSQLFGQNQAILALGKKHDILAIENLNDQGFIVKTGVNYAGNHKNVQIHSYSAELEKRWTVKIENPPEAHINYMLIASSYSPFTFYIQETKDSKSYLITRIDSVGKKEEIAFEKPKDFIDSRQLAIFASDDELIFFNVAEIQSTEKGAKGKKVKGKKEVKYYFYTLKENKTALEKNEIDLQISEEDREGDMFVEYIGHDEDNIFLARKSVNLKESEIEYEIHTLDKTYASTDVSNFIATIDGMVVPAKNLRTTNSGSYVNDNDYDIKVTSSGRYTTTTYIANQGSFGCAKLDIQSGMFYIYGLIADGNGNNSSKSDSKKEVDFMGKEPKSIYISKFDFNTGKKVEEKKFPLSKEFLADDKFTKPFLFVDRCIWFDIVNDNLYRFCGKGNVNSHVMMVAMDTKKTEYIGKSTVNKSFGGDTHCRFMANALGSKSYISTEQSKFLKNHPDFRTKEYSITGIFFGDRTIILKNTSFSKQPQVEFNLFIHNNEKNEQ